jgi:phosphate transport system permease protein
MSNNPFARKVTKAKVYESIWTWVFRLATYFIIACATYLFGDILVKGSFTVFQSEFPYVNYEFFTKPPQTLHVFEKKEINDKISDLKYEIDDAKIIIEEDKPEPGELKELQGKIRNWESEIVLLEKERKKERFLYDNDDFRALEKEPSEDVYDHATYAYTGGGIFPAIAGTILLVLGAMTIALILGVSSAVYLSEYGKPGPVLNLIRLSIINLAGVPSIVFGLFGFGMFVIFLGWNVSLLAGCFTLAFMVLPIIITSSEESLKAIPQGFREASLALGASKWTMIRTNVLPYAMPGILTSSVLGVARVAGETAPIMFTAAYALRDQLPWEGLSHWYDFFFQGVMALPYHIYVVSSKIPQNEYTQSMQYGTAFVFMMIVLGIAFTSIILRIRMRAKYKW